MHRFVVGSPWVDYFVALENQLHNRFERGILKVIAFIGMVRFAIALFIGGPLQAPLTDFYLNLATALIFLAGLVLVHVRATDKVLVAFFFVPLMVLVWVSLYFQNGLASAGEINAFAVVIILSLTIQGRLPWVFIAIFLMGVCTTLYLVEWRNIQSQDSLVMNTDTTALLLVTLANLFMTYHAKNVFDTSRRELGETNAKLTERAEEIGAQRALLQEQNLQLIRLKDELEEKVLERTAKLQQQREAIEQYLQLTLKELVNPYEKTLKAIDRLENTKNNPMVDMVKESGRRMQAEVEKLRTKLLNADE